MNFTAKPNLDGTIEVTMPVTIPGGDEPVFVCVVVRTKKDMVYTGFQAGMVAAACDSLMVAARSQAQALIKYIAEHDDGRIQVVPPHAMPPEPPGGFRSN